MKKFVLAVAFALAGMMTYGQGAGKILGTWITQDGDSKVTIKQDQSGKFYGEIIWLKDPNKNGKPKVDDKNPEASMRNRQILGLRILSGFTFDKGDSQWEDGTIYDPKSGKTYSCKMWFEKDPKTLHVKGFIGVSLIGKEVKWTRES
ncbi:MAG TPA: DUF2147 domain-containing protein [Tenuifilaceae bacterium]|nr:DUF2147 domain-containing protein [Tenuifilaceae bacterium]HQB78428.1 DUF2147 domain-containing protein [Tenuifilaceae bacterium]